MFPVMRNSRTAHGAARCPLGVVLVLFLLSAAVPAAAMDTPLEGIPLPRYRCAGPARGGAVQSRGEAQTVLARAWTVVRRFSAAPPGV